MLPLHSIELDYFLDYLGTSSNKFLTPAGNGHLTSALDHLWFSSIGGHSGVVSMFGVVSLDSLELNTMWCCAAGLAHSGSPFHFHPVFSPYYVNSDLAHAQNLISRVSRDLLLCPTEVKGDGIFQKWECRTALECL